MKHFLKGELTHENKLNVNPNKSKIRRGEIISKLYNLEDSQIRKAELQYKKETRATEQKNNYLLYRLKKKQH